MTKNINKNNDNMVNLNDFIIEQGLNDGYDFENNTINIEGEIYEDSDILINYYGTPKTLSGLFYNDAVDSFCEFLNDSDENEKEKKEELLRYFTDLNFYTLRNNINVEDAKYLYNYFLEILNFSISEDVDEILTIEQKEDEDWLKYEEAHSDHFSIRDIVNEEELFELYKDIKKDNSIYMGDFIFNLRDFVENNISYNFYIDKDFEDKYMVNKDEAFHVTYYEDFMDDVKNEIRDNFEELDEMMMFSCVEKVI